jgi:hypothetical protein
VEKDEPNTCLTFFVVRAKTPTVSSELAYATTPHRDTSPYDGLKPTTPQYAAGRRTEPPVSVPRALKKRIKGLGETIKGHVR